MIRHFDHARFLRNADHILVSDQAAVMQCGCSAFVGFIGREPSIGAVACSPEHAPVMEAFNFRYRASLREPRDALAVEVCEEILEEVFTELTP